MQNIFSQLIYNLGKVVLAGFEAVAGNEVWKSTGCLPLAAESVSVYNKVSLLQAI